MYGVVTQRTTIYISAAVISFKFTSSQDVFTCISKVASAKFMLAMEQSCMRTEEKIFWTKDCSVKVIYLLPLLLHRPFWKFT